MSPATAPAEFAVIGGSGFYAFLEDVVEHDVDTPYGRPAAPITVGNVDTGSGSRRVAFLPRHGRRHEYPAHVVPYRANLWALRSLGVRQILAPCAVGGLRPELGPGTLVIPDQLVDRTTGRIQTYFNEGACHVAFADPYCPRLSRGVVDSLRTQGGSPVEGGTMVVIQGPRFSTRAESQWYAAQGWSLVNMTGHPEAVLARELALCYTPIALVTDLDAGVAAGEAVSQAQVLRVFAEHTDRLRELLRTAIAALPTDRDCDCPNVHEGMTLPVTLP